jgi:hypothetical protein
MFSRPNQSWLSELIRTVLSQRQNNLGLWNSWPWTPCATPGWRRTGRRSAGSSSHPGSPCLINISHFMHHLMHLCNLLKALSDHLGGGGVKSRLIRSLLINWRIGNFFSSQFKWISSQDQQKTNRRRLIIHKVTLTGQSHFMRILLCKVTLHDYTNSVQWMYAIGPKNPLV